MAKSTFTAWHPFILPWLIICVTGNPESQSASPGTPSFDCQQTDSHVSIYCDQNEVLRYNIVPPKAPNQKLAVYERSGYIHPVRTPSGHLVTGDFAPDHAHQHGLFAAWTKTTYRGQPVDFWNQLKSSGIVLHDRVVETRSDDKSAMFRVAVKHCLVMDDQSTKPILDDVWTVHVSGILHDNKLAGYRIEFSVAQTNITDATLTINRYHYGGIGFRGRNDWFSQRSADALKSASKQKPPRQLPPLHVTRHRFATSAGEDRFEGNHSRPDWVALYGMVDAKDAGNEKTDSQPVVGIRMKGSETNTRHPHPVRLHPTKPYFSISPCVLGSFDIEPGTTWNANYTFEVFDGKPAGLH
jgi:hypothetical protein